MDNRASLDVVTLRGLLISEDVALLLQFNRTICKSLYTDIILVIAYALKHSNNFGENFRLTSL